MLIQTLVILCVTCEAAYFLRPKVYLLMLIAFSELRLLLILTMLGHLEQALGNSIVGLKLRANWIVKAADHVRNITPTDSLASLEE